MKIGVTGASGFIGRKLCKALIESDFEVYKFVRREPKNDNEIYWRPSKKRSTKKNLNLLMQ
jgi:nucleoside-diphosphate-sugar epimerase